MIPSKHVSVSAKADSYLTDTCFENSISSPTVQPIETLPKTSDDFVDIISATSGFFLNIKMELTYGYAPGTIS